MRARSLLSLLGVGGFSLLLLALPGCGRSVAPAAQAPADLENAVAQLSDSFWKDQAHAHMLASVWSAQFSFQKALARNREAIDALLAPAPTSPAYANELANQLVSPLRAYAERFKPGSAIDEDRLAQTTPAMDDPLDFDLGLRAYLLLELVKRQRSLALAREAFAALDDVVRASSYLTLQRQLYRHKVDAEFDVAAVRAREQESFGGENPGFLGTEIAWHCESFLASLPKDDPFLPAAAMARVETYQQWRTEAMGPDGPGWLAVRHMFTTITCVRELIPLLA